MLVFLLFTIRTKQNIAGSDEAVENIEKYTTGDSFKTYVIRGLTTMYV